MYFFERAFRSFFLGAAIFAFLSMWIWWWHYPVSEMRFSGVSPLYWHAHEMVFGYALATVSGFLLTAVMNWTGRNSASGKWLALLFIVWVCARLGYIVDLPLEWVALFDLAFSSGLFLHFVVPVVKSRQWKQMGLASKFFLILVANALYYFGAFGILDSGITWGITLGLFLVLGINLTMMRRLIPFFTEKALGLNPRSNSKWLDTTSILGFFALMLAVTFFPSHWIVTLIAIPLALIHAIRAVRWYHPGIWALPLLWSLHFSYGFMVLGMFLYGLAGLGVLSSSLAVHALAAGGIGLLCSSIMARVSLGHTNRSIFETPPGLSIVFGLLAATAVIRVVLPIVFNEHYVLWVTLSQWGWALAFLLLSVLYWPILTKPSLDDHSPIRL